VVRAGALNGAAAYFVRRPAHKALPAYYSPAAKSWTHLLDVLRHRELPDGHMARHLANVVGGFGDVGGLMSRHVAHVLRPRDVLALRVVLEATPNPESRVTLGSRKDRHGTPRVRVDWRLNERDRRGLEALRVGLHEEFARAGLGSLFTDTVRDRSGWPASMAGGKHHMGTTRMHADPAQGVVDANCRVHECENLFVAGSSVFPTGGCTNPTLTIVALAVRLADHIAGMLRSGASDGGLDLSPLRGSAPVMTRGSL
jgi:choline dehydrogenase-like flavoprotein